MILSDFLTLESYFSSEESARFFEDISQKYGTEPLKKCIESGEIICRKVYIGPDQGRVMLFLSDKGRSKALNRGILGAE